MNWQQSALTLAGVIGVATAIFHGILVQRLMVRPIETAFSVNTKIAAPVRRIVPMLLHMSTVIWLIGSVVLIVAAYRFDPAARLWTGVFVGSLLAYGVVGNFWGSRGRHPGWMLLGTAVILIGYGVS